MANKHPPLIFESPDKGDTVYAILPGSSERVRIDSGRNVGIGTSSLSGADPATRKEVGWGHDPRTSDGRPLRDHIMDDQLWGKIRRAAKSNPTLHEALERAKIIYHLSNESNL
jgi:hypothetical protein